MDSWFRHFDAGKDATPSIDSTLRQRTEMLSFFQLFAIALTLFESLLTGRLVPFSNTLFSAPS